MISPLNSYQWAVEEMSLSGRGIALPLYSRSTLYRWARECNAILAREKAGWRVKADVKSMSLDIVQLEPDTAEKEG